MIRRSARLTLAVTLLTLAGAGGTAAQPAPGTAAPEITAGKRAQQCDGAVDVRADVRRRQPRRERRVARTVDDGLDPPAQPAALPGREAGAVGGQLALDDAHAGRLVAECGGDARASVARVAAAGEHRDVTTGGDETRDDRAADEAGPASHQDHERSVRARRHRAPGVASAGPRQRSA